MKNLVLYFSFILPLFLSAQETDSLKIRYYEKTILKSLSISVSEQENYRTLPCTENAIRLTGIDKYDSRFEKFQLDSLIIWQRAVLEKSKSVAIIIEEEQLFDVSEQEYQLDTYNTLGEIYNLCDDQAFFDQPVVGAGTGFIIGSNKMVTANHVFERPIEDYIIVFGYQIVDELKKVNTIITRSNIFYPRKVLQKFVELDVVVFEVDRDFDRPFLEWKTSRDLEQENEIYMIGYPSGLPQKIALNAGIVDNSKSQYFLTSLDSFQGNSGSPIFDFCTNKVIGVLVSGQLDYKYNGSCYEASLCEFPYCEGEKVIRIEEIINE